MTDFSTTTLIAMLPQEPRWSTQIQIARQLTHRRDVFNVAPLCEFLLQENRNRDVQRAVAECVASRGAQEAIHWLTGKIFDVHVPTRQKELALRALADFRLPKVTIPLLIRVCRASLAPEVRRAAFFRLGHSGRLETVRFLAKLAAGNDHELAKEARGALQTLIELHGGVEATLDKLLDLASTCVRRGQRAAGARFLGTAIRIGSGTTGTRLRQRLAA